MSKNAFNAGGHKETKLTVGLAKYLREQVFFVKMNQKDFFQIGTLVRSDLSLVSYWYEA